MKFGTLLIDGKKPDLPEELINAEIDTFNPPSIEEPIWEFNLNDGSCLMIQGSPVTVWIKDMPEDLEESRQGGDKHVSGSERGLQGVVARKRVA